MPPTKSPPDLGRRLSAARLRRGLSQGTVARRAGIAPSYLSRVENGRVQPTFRTVMRLARALGSDLAELADPASDRRTGPCPVSSHGRCLLDLIRSDDEVARSAGEETYSPRQIRLLGRLAVWMRRAAPDRLRAMEILLEDLARNDDA